MKITIRHIPHAEVVGVRVLDEWDYIVEHIKRMRKEVDNDQYPEAYDI